MSNPTMSQCVTTAEEILAVGRATLAAEAGASRVRAELLERSSRARAVLAVGKAAWSMAQGAASVLGDSIPALVIGKETPPSRMPAGATVLLAGHPRPDERSAAATRAALDFVRRLDEGDELLVLLSGGTSALLGGPIDGVSLEELAALTDALLRSGLPIDALNRVRRRLGAALGGRLALATKARLRVLVLSDVATDDLRVIGSGPVSTPPLDDAEAASAIAETIGADPSIVDRLRRAEPSPGEILRRLSGRVIGARILAGPRTLAASATVRLFKAGYVVKAPPRLADGPVEALVERLLAEARALAPGEAFVIAGEPTVRVTGRGRGGRAQHAALLAIAGLAPLADRALLALASDGSDGPTDAAGALVSAETAAEAARRGIDLERAIVEHDSHAALAALDVLVRTGPTGTNLTDLYVVARAR